MKRILVIDDEESLRSNLLDVLGFEGYEALGAGNGRDGVLIAQRNQPDLIICDIAMPDWDGFEVITELHKCPQTAGIPVIFLSAHNGQNFIQKGMRLGAAAYLTKPYHLDDLLAAIRAQLDT